MAPKHPCQVRCQAELLGHRDAPEIDGYVVVEKELAIGQMVPVIVTGAMEYDLVAMPADEPILVM